MTSTLAGDRAPGPWSPLRVRLFRNLWLASLVSNVGTWMQMTAVSLVVYELTGNATVQELEIHSFHRQPSRSDLADTGITTACCGTADTVSVRVFVDTLYAICPLAYAI